MQAICECNSTECLATFNVPLRELQRVKATPGNIVIANDCPTGPEPTDVLVSKERGYTIYKEN